MAGYNPSNFFKGKVTSKTTEVKTTIDPRVITNQSERKVMDARAIEEYQREAARGTKIGNTASNLGLSSSMKRSDNLLKFKVKVQNKQIKSIPQACMNMNLSEATIISYLKELQIPYNKQSGKIG